MKDLTHENVLLALMAAADGESAPMSPEEIEGHLRVCVGCREEAVRMQRVSDLFQQASRREGATNLWPTIETRLDQKPSRRHWKLFAIAGLLLLVYKLCEMLPDADPGWAIKLVPLIIFGALLVFLKENPFRINTDLVLEK